jgi:MFS family permease
MFTPDSTGTATPPGPFVTVSVLLLASLTIMANATISPSLPGLKANFADTPGIETLTGMILTLPSLAIIFAAAIFGLLADRMNRAFLLIVAGLLYALGGASGLIAETLPQLLAGRLFLGIGVAGAMTLALAWGSDLFQGPARARFLGMQGAAMSAGGIVVIILGGYLSLLHWRGAFAVYLLGLPIAVTALIALRPYAKCREGSVLTATDEEQDGRFPWGVYAFVGVLAFLFMGTFYILPTRIPFRLEEMGTTNTLVVGLFMAVVTVAAIPGSLIYGWCRRLFSPMTIFAAAFALMALGLFLISQADTHGVMALGLMICGFAMGPAMPNFTTYLMAFVPAALRGRAAGLISTPKFAGQIISPLISAPFVSRFGLVGGFLALAMILAIVAAALTLGALVKRSPAGTA